MSRWSTAGLAPGTSITSTVIANTTGNGDTVTRSVSGTSSATSTANGGVDITAAVSGIWRLDLDITSGLYSVGQLLYIPYQHPLTAHCAISQLRGGASGATAIANGLMHYTTGILGFQDRLAATVAGANSPTIDLNKLYLIDHVGVVGVDITHGRWFYRIRNLDDPAWGTNSEFFYDSGETLDLGTTATPQTQQRMGKVTSGAAFATGFNLRSIGWGPLPGVDTTINATIAKNHFMPFPTRQQIAHSRAILQASHK